jgi:hypothetical protein
VYPATHPPGRGRISKRLDADDGFAACSGTIPFGGPVLTGEPRPASVPVPAGLTG